MIENTNTFRQRPNVAGTPLQLQLLRLHELLVEVRELGEQEQAAFGSIAQHALVASLGGPMVVDEATDYLRAA